MKKKNKKNSPNRLKCQITGAERMSNAKYLAAKGEKFEVTGNVWASFYVSKEGLQKLKTEVEIGGLQFAADAFKTNKGTIIKWLRYNGRGGFVKVGVTPPALLEKAA
jgi:hypothetical protein